MGIGDCFKRTFTKNTPPENTKTPPQYTADPEPINKNIWRPARNNPARAQSYQTLFDTCVINKGRESEIARIIEKVKIGKPRYQEISEKTRVPWEIIAVIHLKESSFNWKTHLHNGDPLTARTRQVPAGRPKAGNPPFTFEASAIDALLYEREKVGIPDNYVWDIPNALYFLERYNGEGYRNHGVNSPYLWCACNHYTKGHYRGDGNWQPNAIAKNPGAAVVLKTMGWRGNA